MLFILDIYGGRWNTPRRLEENDFENFKELSRKQSLFQQSFRPAAKNFTNKGLFRCDIHGRFYLFFETTVQLNNLKHMFLNEQLKMLIWRIAQSGHNFQNIFELRLFCVKNNQEGLNKEEIKLNLTYFLFSYLMNSIYLSNDT